MSDKFIEKSFLYLLLFSLLLHSAVIALFLYLPVTETPPPKEPVFIDLQQMPELKSGPRPPQPEAKRHSEQRMRVERETAPRGNAAFDSGARLSPPLLRPHSRAAQPSAIPTPQAPLQQRDGQVIEGSSASGLLKPRSQASTNSGQTQLFPGASRMAKLEETYRRKFENDIAEGDTKFLNTDDIQFGSFLRHFEDRVYGVWTYPQEAARNGIQGITPVKITFNRDGSINYAKTRLLESSGSKILDDEVLRTLRAIGPIGQFPKGYDKDEFNLIAFFQYGMSRRSLK